MNPEDRERLGYLLIDEGIITEEEMTQALAEGGARNTALASLLGKARHPRRNHLASWLASDYRMPEIADLRRVELMPSLAQLVPATMARRIQALPLGRFGNILVVARGPAQAHTSMAELRKMTGLKVKVVAADEAQVTAAIESLYGVKKTVIPEPKPLARPPAPAPVATADPAKYDTVPILNVVSVAPPPGTEAAFTEVEEIVPAQPVSRAEYDQQLRTPMAQFVRAWEELFVEGKLVRPARVG